VDSPRDLLFVSIVRPKHEAVKREHGPAFLGMSTP
jgi:hypothetical protein